jgi:hypothetical protein
MGFSNIAAEQLLLDYRAICGLRSMALAALPSPVA